MPFIPDFLPTVRDIRAIPGQYGIRPHAVSLVEILNSGEHPGNAGTALDTQIYEGDEQNPKVRWLNDEELAVGQLASGTIEVGPITPVSESVGVALGRYMATDLETNDQIYLRITGPRHPDGALYRLTRINAEKATRYMLRAVPTADS